MKIWSLSLFALFLHLNGWCQLTIEQDFDLNWQQENGEWTFPQAHHEPSLPGQSFYISKIPLPNYGVVTAQLEVTSEILLNIEDHPELPGEYPVTTYVQTEGDQSYAFVHLGTKKGPKITGIQNGTLHIFWQNIAQSPTGKGPTLESALSKGDIFKLSIPQTGLYKITGADISAQTGFSLSSIDFKRIDLLGNPGGMLNQDNDEVRNDDLQPIPIQWVGLEDNKLDPKDYFIFYAEGAETWKYSNDQWKMSNNPYGDYNYVFLRLGQDEGKKVGTTPTLPIGGLSLKSSYVDLQYHGREDINLLGRSIEHEGSGILWLTEELSNTRSSTLTKYFDIENRVIDQPIVVNGAFYTRAEASSSVEWHFGNEVVRVNSGRITKDIEAIYARRTLLDAQVNPSSEQFDIQVRYPEIAVESEGWLDYLTLEIEKNFVDASHPLYMTHRFTEGQGGYTIDQYQADHHIWDITNYNDVTEILPETVGGKASFAVDSPAERRFVSFKYSQVTNKPDSWEKVDHQNLHGIQDADLITIYHPLFKEQAERHAEYRRSHDGLEVVTVNINHIFNEFCSGRREPTAIRDFAKMVSERSPRFKYLLLFGDGSYDYRHTDKNVEDQNFIPVYETIESLDPIYAYPSDDYYGLLSSGEGSRLRGQMEISVGRLVCRNAEEAKLMVDKIIHYETHPGTLGDWRNRNTYLADDEDTNQHLTDMDFIANDMDTKYPVYNQSKVYFDAYEQVSTPGGTRFPEATQDINANAFNGSLTMVYLGHGGPTGLAQERVLQSNDIKDWDNLDNMPIIITATCSFTSFDEPSITSAGEYSVLSPTGGAIAILSTVRAVFANDNFALTRAVHNYLFEKIDGQAPRLGDVIRQAKNSISRGGDDSNSRKFTLFGDPAMKIAIPQYQVAPLVINDQPLDGFNDTLGALDHVKISGEIWDHDDQKMTDFSGEIDLTVFDKKITLRTRGTDSGSYPRDYQLQNNVLFKGSATVTGGEWELEFVLPKDINFNIGQGKFSFYAHDGQTRDAHGEVGSINIGGSGNNNITDDQGPVVEVYMNDSNFISGGITHSNPSLFVRVKDDYGINVVGNSIGHDMTAVLDDDTRNTYVLNDFYQAKRDDYTEGTVLFPLYNLKEGRHRIKVTAWDIANNFGEGETEFIVVSNAAVSIEKVLSYPNPFTDFTRLGFEHNLGPGVTEIEVQIVDQLGRAVQTIKETVPVTGFRVTDIVWEGTDYSGKKVPSGVYLYKIIVRRDVLGRKLQKESSFERVVVLK